MYLPLCNLMKFVLMCCHARLSDTKRCLISTCSYFFQSYADMLTPYMNSVPAVIAKASAIHNPIIYAITHPKYRYAGAGVDFTECLGSASSYCWVVSASLECWAKIEVTCISTEAKPQIWVNNQQLLFTSDFQYKDLSSEMRHGSSSNTCCVLQGRAD